MDKPFSQACENNREPIFEVLKRVFAEATTVLEIGSGTGQHAVYFGKRLPKLRWQTSNRAAYHEGIKAWLDEAQLPNVAEPLSLDVQHDAWPSDGFDAVFSANTAHIMSLEAVSAMFAGVGRLLKPGGLFALYGPFNYGGASTSDSNQRFDAQLRANDPDSGIRDFEAIAEFAAASGMSLLEDNSMPANNRLLVWQKS